MIRLLTLAASAAWGYAEATLFFIVPDVLIGLAALRSWKAGVESALAATAGALVGGIAVFRDHERYRARFRSVPGITDALLADASARFARDGWAAVVRAPLDGIPYKVYAAEAAARGEPLAALVAVTPPARYWRFIAVAAGSALAGTLARRAGAGPGLLVAGYGAAWIATYVAYFRSLRRRYRHQR